MSGCGSSSCGCGSSCNCGTDCKCNYPNLEISASHVTIIQGVAPPMMFFEGAEESFGAEGGQGCKCGSGCKCNLCTC